MNYTTTCVLGFIQTGTLSGKKTMTKSQSQVKFASNWNRSVIAANDRHVVGRLTSRERDLVTQTGATLLSDWSRGKGCF